MFYFHIILPECHDEMSSIVMRLSREINNDQTLKRWHQRDNDNVFCFTSAYCKYSLLALTGAALFLTSNMATAAKTQYPLTIKTVVEILPLIKPASRDHSGSEQH